MPMTPIGFLTVPTEGVGIHRICTLTRCKNCTRGFGLEQIIRLCLFLWTRWCDTEKVETR